MPSVILIRGRIEKGSSNSMESCSIPKKKKEIIAEHGMRPTWFQLYKTLAESI
jgi:hypothetical protein